MKAKYTTSFLFIVIFISAFFTLMSNQAQATHAAGGQITYTHLNGNCYLIRLTFYRDCIGIQIVQPIIVQIGSVSCSQSTTLQLNPVPGTGQEITNPCPGHATTCTGGSEPGLQKWEFEGQYCFPAQCSDWLINIAFSARNSSITTIQNPGGNDIYIEARLNNLTGDNNSPQFSINPNLFVCIGQGVIFSNGVVDPDGDSLVYSLISARTAANTNVIYYNPYSASQPVTSIPPISLDANTGDMFIQPTSPEVGIIVFEVQEFRNGILIGSVMRDINVYTVPCTNQVPAITGVNGTSLNSIYVLAEQSFCFNVFCYDDDSGDSLEMISNNGIPGGLFTTYGSTRPTGVFCWTPTLADVSPQPHVLTITVLDQNCPAQGMAVNYFSIYVTTDTSLASPLYAHGYFSGNVYYDINSNGVKDIGEINMSSQRISMQMDDLHSFTNLQGNFLLYSQSNGSHSITIDPSSDWIVTSDSASYTVTDDSTNQTGFDFGVNSPFLLNGLGVSIVPGIPRCNNLSIYHITCENTGTTLLSGRLIFLIDSATNFSSSIPPYDQLLGDSVIYNFTNLWPSQTYTFHVTLLLPGPGDTIHFAAFAEFDSLGVFYSAGEQALQQIVTCSYDPNDKLVFPEGLYTEHRTLYNEELQYTIRFQNSGTDTAFTVFIHDFIDPSLDLSTLHITGYSHPMNVTVFSNRMVEFRFEDILLPDSNVDEPESHGYVQYKISPLPNLLLPIVVSNEANIFFDSNFPVLTNNVWNTLVSDLYVGIAPVEGTNETISVVPNPFSNNARLIFSKSFINTETTFILMDAMGRMVEKRIVKSSELVLTKGNLNSGFYFFELSNETGNRAIGKLIME